MKLFVTAAAGTEGALRDELRAARFRGVKADRGGVHLEGDLVEGARACLMSRVGMRVQVELARFEARGEDGLYDGVRSMDWSPWITPRHTLAVSATCKSSKLTHSQFIALKTKDAIVDQLRDRHGARPDVDPRSPDVSVIVRLVNDQASVYLDLAGEPLHRRGYRAATRDAVMKENLAAAVILLAGWTPEHPFVDPMCGAGTLPIEAALMARRIPPGAKRSFGIERSPAWDEAARRAWRQVRGEALAQALPAAPAPIYARDGVAAAVAAATENVRAAGVLDTVRVLHADARSLVQDHPGTWVFGDPPYGDRTAVKPLQLMGFFRQLGEVLRGMHGATAAFITGTDLLPKNLGLTHDMEHSLRNGDIPCKLFRYRVP
ncbi:MAG: THUMP domain-containing protein [Polyangiales bacterium]